MFEIVRKHILLFNVAGTVISSFVGALLTSQLISRSVEPPEKIEGLPPSLKLKSNSTNSLDPTADPNQNATGKNLLGVSSDPNSANSNANASSDNAGSEAASNRAQQEILDTGLPPLLEYEIILVRNIFDSEHSLHFSENGSSGDPQALEAPPVVPLNVRLMGTVVASPEKFSWALISKNEPNSSPETFMVGEDIYQQGSLRSIRRNEILVRKTDGTDEVVGLFDPTKAGTTMEPPPSGAPSNMSTPSTKGGDLPDDAVRKISDTKYEIDSKALQSIIDSPEKLQKSARIVPSFDNGTPNGFKIFRIKNDSLYNKMGFKNGDVIARMNGVDINSSEKALQMYQMMKTDKHISMDILRNGQKMTMEYNVK